MCGSRANWTYFRRPKKGSKWASTWTNGRRCNLPGGFAYRLVSGPSPASPAAPPFLLEQTTGSMHVFDLRIFRLALELRSRCCLQVYVKESADIVPGHSDLAATI